MTSLACLTPLPPARSGVADYSACLLQALARRVDVVAYAPAPADPIPGVQVRRPTRRELRRLDRFDVVLAQVGNSDLHAWILDAIGGRPSVVTIHDVVLHHLVAGMTFGRGDAAGYVEAMAAEHGAAGRLLGHGVAAHVIPPLWEVAPSLYPLTGRAVRDAAQVIVHSTYAAERIRTIRSDVPVHVIPLLTPPPAAAAPEPLGGAPFPVVGCFGFVIREKRLPVVMEAFGRLRERHPQAHLLVVGQAVGGLDPAAMARVAGLPDTSVTAVGYEGRERYDALMRSVHIGVNLRHPTMGESSAAVAQLLSLGIPTIVSTGGWYDELPAAAVERIAPGAGEAAALATALEELTDDDGRRTRMGDAGRRYARDRMSPDACAEAYLRACLAATGRASMGADLIDGLAAGLAMVAPAGARARTEVVADVAEATRFLGVV